MRISRIVTSIVTLGLTASPAFAGGETAFTYQGRLLDAGEPANGLFDFRFALFSTVIGGVPIGAVAPDKTSVTDGLFTVQIDFGADAFDNTERWLEITVSEITLSPRQPITRAPYAIQTRGMFIGDDGNILFHSLNEVEGTVTISSIGGIDLILDADTNNIGEDQNARIVMMQDGGQVVGRMGYREDSNQLEIMQEFDSDLILGTNNEDRLTIDPDGNVGIGTTTPQFPLEVVRDGGTAIGAHNTAASGASLGLFGRSDSTSGLGVFGWGTANSGSNYGVRGESDSTSGTGVRGDATATSGITYGVWGQSASPDGRGVYGRATATSGNTYGAWFQSDSTFGKGLYSIASASSGATVGIWGTSESTLGLGVFGFAGASSGAVCGVKGQSVSTTGMGVFGVNTASSGVNYGVWGQSQSTSAVGVFGRATEDSGSSFGVRGETNSPDGFGVFSDGDFGGTGAKYFIQPHPSDPSKEIRFICLEGNESGTYFRGSTQLVDGQVVIDVPEEFRLVTDADGLTVQVTAKGPNAGLWVETETLEQIIVRGNGNVQFNYLVNGVRLGFADHESIRENHAYVPQVRGVPYGTQYREGHRRILVDNGILNQDFTPNEATAAMMGWTLRDPELVGQPKEESKPNSGDKK